MSSETRSNDREDLLSRLVSADWRERRQAVEALSGLGDADLARAVLDIIQRRHLELAALSGSLKALAEMGCSLTDELLDLLRGPDIELRIYITLALGELGDPASIPALVEVAQSSQENENVRFNAIEALGKLGASEAVEALREVLQHGSPFLRYAAVVALGQAGDFTVMEVLFPLLSDPYLVEPAITALGQLSGRGTASEPNFTRVILQAVEGITASLEQDHLTTEGLMDAVIAISQFGERISPSGALVKDTFMSRLGPVGRRRLLALAGAPEDQRLPAQLPESLTRLLGWMAGSSDVESRSALVWLLRNPAARPAVERALSEGAFHTAAGSPFMPLDALAALLEDTDAESTYAATRLAGRLLENTATPGQAQPIVDLLVGVLSAQDDMLVALAAEALGRLHIPEVIQPVSNSLLPLLDHSSARVRLNATEALAALRPDDLNAQAANLLEDPNPNLREAGLLLLVLLDAEQTVAAAFRALADPSGAVRRSAIELLPRFDDPRVIPALAQALQDPDDHIRASATRALAGLNSPESGQLILQAAQDHNGWVRMHAIRAIGQRLFSGDLPKDPGLSVLFGGLNDPLPPARIAAVEALGALEDERIPGALTPLLEDEFVDVRNAALAALEKIKQTSGGIGE